MKDNSLKILEQFTRKLLNCRYRVPINSIIEYLSSGKFGYSIDAKENKIVTNEYVYADDISIVIKHMKAILGEPHVSLKQEEVVQLSSIANKTDANSLNKTIKDEKLWKIKSSEIKPEYVHSYVQEENLAIYENRFICYLIDMLFENVNEKINDLCANVKTVNKEIAKNILSSKYTINDYINYVDENNGLPILLSNEDANVGVISSLIKSKKILMNLKTYDVYKACKKAGAFDGEKVQNTNIFDNEQHYNYCYNFFKKYLNKEIQINSYESIYRAFIEVNIFSVINDLGFKPDNENENILVSNSATIKYDSVSFTKSPFTITISQEESGVKVSILNNVDGNISKNFIKISYADDESAKNIENIENYLNVYTVTNNANNKDAIIVSPENANAKKVIEKIIKSLLLVVEGSEFVYGRYCPICGSALVAPDATDFCCVSCESVYHIYNYEYKDIIWIKHLKSLFKNVKSEEIVLEEVAIAEDVKTPPKQRQYISKSFVGKMSQAKQDVKNYYNEVKNYVLKFDKTRSNTSWSYDNFFVGRNSKIKLGFRGKVLVMYINLPFGDYEGSKYFPKYFGDVKKYEDTPMMVKVKSTRGVKFAKELIDKALLGLGDKKNFKEEVYKFPKKSNAKLLELNLAKKSTIIVK